MYPPSYLKIIDIITKITRFVGYHGVLTGFWSLGIKYHVVVIATTLSVSPLEDESVTFFSEHHLPLFQAYMLYPVLPSGFTRKGPSSVIAHAPKEKSIQDLQLNDLYRGVLILL